MASGGTGMRPQGMSYANTPAPTMRPPNDMRRVPDGFGMPPGFGQITPNTLGKTPNTQDTMPGTMLAPHGNGGSVMGQNGQSYQADPVTGRPIGAGQAYTGGEMNPNAGRFGDYTNPVGDGLWGTDANGINRINGHEWASGALNSGNTDFSNYLNYLAPIYQQHRGPIGNMGQANTWGAPQSQSGTGFIPGSGMGAGPGPSNGFGRGGTPPPFDPRQGMPNQFDPWAASRQASAPAPLPTRSGIDPNTGRPYGMRTF